MVQSQVVSITPAQHADAHRIGGTDPLTGAVGIDGLGLTWDGTEVVPTNLVGAWTDIDLSAIVGAKRTLVILRVNNDAAATMTVGFRPKGDTDDMGSGTQGGAHFVKLSSVADEAGIAICYTNAAGVLQYISVAGVRIATIDLIAWGNLA